LKLRWAGLVQYAVSLIRLTRLVQYAEGVR
jgi:hypothetical protein